MISDNFSIKKNFVSAGHSLNVIKYDLYKVYLKFSVIQIWTNSLSKEEWCWYNVTYVW